MSLHTKAFWAMTSFLAGVFMAEVMAGRWLVVCWLLVLLGIIACFLVGRTASALFLFCVGIGFSYYAFYDQYIATPFTAPLNQQVALVGMVSKTTKTDGGQSVDVALRDEYQGKIRVYADEFPVFAYGDILAFSATVKSPTGESAGYFKKEGIGGLVSYPKNIIVQATHQGVPMMAWLYEIRDGIRSTFERVLPGEQATLMTGLVIGKSSGFSKEFSEKLKTTGTTHLVALSGYNIATVLGWFSALLGFFLRRRKALWFSMVAVVAFVVMTGAEASVVRAAIMAIIVVIAEQIERPHSVRNAIVFAALCMTIANPHILVFDIGFQLSFAALVGIVYVKPAIDLWLHRDKKNVGVLAWRENLVTTLAAQVAVLPILLFHFGFVTPVSIVTNVLLLSFIPLTMVLGVAILLAELISSALAFFAAVPARLLLGYELWVIDAFSNIEIGYEAGSTSFIFIVCYYALLLGGILWVRRRYGESRDAIASKPQKA